MAWLELSAPFLWPAFDDDFGLGVEFNAVAALGVQVAEETFFPSTKGKEGHGGGNAEVDADVARVRFITKLAGGGAAGREDAGHVAVVAAIDQFDGLIHVVDRHQAQYRSEQFGPREFTFRFHAIQDGGEEEAAVFVSPGRFFSAIDNHARPG